MRAIDYLNSLNSCLKYKDEVKRIIEEINPIKYDEKATADYYERVLTPDLKHKKDRTDSVGKSGEMIVIAKEAKKVRFELFNTVKEDKSFSYLFCLLAQEQNRINPQFKSNPIDCTPLPYADNDMDFYYNVENIPNTTLVPGVVQYFEKGDGKGSFEPLDFLNLLWLQRKFITENINKAQTVIDYLNGLHLDEKRRHILLCFIIKWAGGYPVSILDRQYRTTYSRIVEEFLKYPEDTPEKEFCHNRWHNNLAISRDIVNEEDWQKTQIDMLKKELDEKDAEIANLKTVNNQSDETGTSGTTKVKTATLLQILKKAGAGKSDIDLSKLIRLIAYLTGQSYPRTYEIARKGITFSESHVDEIGEVNKLLDDIKIGISIDKDKEY